MRTQVRFDIFVSDRQFSGIKTVDVVDREGLGYIDLIRAKHKIFKIDEINTLMSDWPVVSYVVCKTRPKLTEYKYEF